MFKKANIYLTRKQERTLSLAKNIGSNEMINNNVNNQNMRKIKKCTSIKYIHKE